MHKTIQGNPKNAKGKVAIVVSRFNEALTRKLLAGCQQALAEYGCGSERQTVVWVPGSFEIPVTAKKLAETKAYGAVICLGAVVKGDTYHFEMVAQGAARGIQQAALLTGVPVIFGIITAYNWDQALARAGEKAGNKGWEAALAALEMMDVLAQV